MTISVEPETTVFIVDDDPAIRSSLAAMAEMMGLRAELYATGTEFLEAYDGSRPGCVVLDLRLPGMDGNEVLENLTLRNVPFQAVMISGHGDVPMAVRAMRSGAIDFLEKPFRPQQLRETIRHTIELDAKKRDAQARRQQIEDRLALLTSDENAVLEGIIAGKTNKVIASELGVSLRTVQFRRSSIMRKLEVESRAALMELVLSVREPAGDIGG